MPGFLDLFAMYLAKLIVRIYVQMYSKYLAMVYCRGTYMGAAGEGRYLVAGT